MAWAGPRQAGRSGIRWRWQAFWASTGHRLALGKRASFMAMRGDEADVACWAVQLAGEED